MAKTKAIKELDIDVADASTLIQAIRTTNYSRMACQFVVADFALSAFLIKGQVHPEAPVETLFSSSESYTSPAGLMISCSGDLTAIGAGNTGSFVLDVGGYYEIKLYATSSNEAGSGIDLFIGLR
jgi:hypothetical protein